MPLARFVKSRPRLAQTLHKIRFFAWRPAPVNSGVILRNLADRCKDIFFIQIGSNDGIGGNPLYPFIREHQWKGVLVEPLPEIFARLKSNYHNLPGLIFENCAISPKIGETPIYTLSELNGHNSSRVSSLLFEVIARQKMVMPDFAERFVVRYVKSRPLSDLFEIHDVTRVDLLHIDTEGYDFEILKMLDFTNVRPSVILFEHQHLSADSYWECLEHMKRIGYKYFFRDGQDTIATIDKLLL